MGDCRRITILLLLVGVVLVTPVAGQTVLVQRNVNLRRDPSTEHPPLRLLRPPEELELLDSLKTNNYYHVRRAESDETGWVWANNVRIVRDSAPGTFVVDSAATAIEQAWAKPPAVVGAFQSPATGISCGPGGDGGDTLTNRLKNRTDVPASYHVVSFDAIGDLSYPATRSTFRTRWPADSLAVVEAVEGVAVQVTGYLVAIKPQGGNGESTNCHMTRATEVDWHMALVEDEGDGEAESIVVETTPRIRVGHPKWTVSRLRPWVDSRNPVRVSGWLMFDPAHRNHLGRFRKTLWEIHPITKIEVLQGGIWVDTDSLP